MEAGLDLDEVEGEKEREGGSLSKDERIEKMYREKQERIARHTALKAAINIVALSEHSKLADAEKTAGKVLDLAERFYEWLRGR